MKDEWFTLRSTELLVFRAWEAKDSSVESVFHHCRFSIAPQWIRPTLTATLTPSECLAASESVDDASVLLPRRHVGIWPGSRGVTRGGCGDELRQAATFTESLETAQTHVTGGGRLSSVHRHRSRVVLHSPDEGRGSFRLHCRLLLNLRLKRCIAPLPQGAPVQ